MRFRDIAFINFFVTKRFDFETRKFLEVPTIIVVQKGYKKWEELTGERAIKLYNKYKKHGQTKHDSRSSFAFAKGRLRSKHNKSNSKTQRRSSSTRKSNRKVSKSIPYKSSSNDKSKGNYKETSTTG